MRFSGSVNRWCSFLAALVVGFVSPMTMIAAEITSLTVIVGAEGEEAYAEVFNEWAGRWEQAAQTARIQFQRIGGTTSSETSTTSSNAESLSDVELIKDHLAKLASAAPDAAWIVLIGHGTFDGQSARFNLVGPDMTADQLANWTKDITCPLVIVNCASASGPFINAISGPGRTVITATKNGSEQNFARFGDALSRVIAANQIDYDKDGQTSLLEAVVEAVEQTQAYYRDDGRLATEHALIDDNGDGRGTRVDWFQGVRVDRSKARTGDNLDGRDVNGLVLIPNESSIILTTEQQQRRDELEVKLETLRDSRPDPLDEKYLAMIEPFMVELARIYAAAADSDLPSTDGIKIGEQKPAE